MGFSRQEKLEWVAISFSRIPAYREPKILGT